ncbi:MAG: hypothetical protein M3Q23_11805 [Actinomycetota bacterium]|nr:hypothetical protein [Actinomycetota bacterium]
MRKNVSLAIAAGVLIAGLVAGTTGAIAGSDLSAPITIKVFTKLISQTTVNAGAAGISQGDQLIVNDSLTQNGKIVGSDAQVCTWTNPNKKQLNCVWSLSLFARGQVVLTGIVNFNNTTNTLAVTGGTSTLSNTRGYATVLNFKQKTNTIILHLTP